MVRNSYLQAERRMGSSRCGHDSTIQIKIREWQCTAETVCLSDDDGLKHMDSLFKSKYTAKDMGTLGFEASDVKSLLLLNRVFRVGLDQTGQYTWTLNLP